jgi:UTP--glucose-1-phosphate uridylyltransferase
VGNEPFAVLLADDLMVGPTPITQQLIDVHRAHGGSVLAVQDVPLAQTRSYGIVAGPVRGDRLSQVTHMVEKPAPDKAPSTLAVAGRYVLSGKVFELLARNIRGVGDEIQLTDAIASLIEQEPVHAWRYHGHRYDCGSKLGLLQASVDLGEHHPEVGDAFGQWLRERQPLSAFNLGMLPA